LYIEMFRTAVRQFAAISRRCAGSVPDLTVPQIEEAYRWGIEISKAQKVAQRGLCDGIHTHFSLSFNSSLTR
jgi:hypothetical protein